jgi:hypothetical protein
VYFQGLVEKVRVLYLEVDNKKVRKEFVSWLIVEVIYIIGFFLLCLLSFTNSILIGEICVIIFGAIFRYNVIIQDSILSIDYYFDGLPCMLIMSLIGMLLLYSITSMLVNIKNLLNMQ